MFDAKALWWPPLQRFYDFLVDINAKDADENAREIEVCPELAERSHVGSRKECI